MTNDSHEASPPHPQTRLIHSGRDPEAHNGFVNAPAYRGSTVVFPTLERLKTRAQNFTYGRRATPTTQALEEIICELEGGHGSILVSCGLQAVTVTLLALTKAGDEVLMTDNVYQPTRAFCDRMLQRLGVSTRYYDPGCGDAIEQLISPKTRVIFMECPGSQTFEMQDVKAIAAVARRHGIWSVMDNTWASPLFFQPLKNGVDISIQAATKYIVGHADAMLGAITSNANAFPLINDAKEDLGTSPGSEETYLGMRGIRTLDVRLRQHHTSGVRVAQWLSEQTDVLEVMHPALPTHPGHNLWRRNFKGASGLFGFRLKRRSEQALAAFVDHLALFDMGYSWGGYESLILPCNPTASRSATSWPGPDDSFTLRLHIGLENVDDLIADLAAGIERYRQTAD